MRPVLAFLLCLGCSSSATSLQVDLRTDLVLGLEFDTVVVRVVDSFESGTTLDSSDHVADPGSDYFQGVEVARFDDLERGIARVVVDLQNDGEVQLSRQVVVELDGRTGVTVLMTRDCRFVSCPADDGNPNATACVGGRCADPSCTEETPELCEMVCSADTDCPGLAECARSVCEGVACTAQSVAGACPAGEVCDPDRGCVDPACGSCDDSNACTVDACVDGECSYTPRPGATCGTGTCEGDRCVIGLAPARGFPLAALPRSAAMAGGDAVIGMPDIDTVQVYRFDGEWQELIALSPGDAGFGCEVAMSEERLAVLACDDSSVTLFRRGVDDRYEVEQRIDLADIVPTPELGPGFERPIALRGDLLVIGVITLGVTFPGSGVAIFEDGGGAWTQVDYLSSVSTTFGGALAVDERIIVGDPGDSASSGEVRIYEREAADFEEVFRATVEGDVTQLGSLIRAFSPGEIRVVGRTGSTLGIFKVRFDGEWSISREAEFPFTSSLDFFNAMRAEGRPAESVDGVAEAGLVELRYFSIRATVREMPPVLDQRLGAIVATDGSSALLAGVPRMGGPSRAYFVTAGTLEQTVERD